MKADEFFKSIKEGQILPCYLFEGEEEYLKESALLQIRSKVIVPPFGDMNETVLTNPSSEELIAVCETLPMMADKRLVIVKDSALLAGSSKDSPKAGKKSDSDGDKVCAYIKNLPSTTCLVFFTRGKANGVRKLYKEINKLGGLVNFESLTNDGLVKWIARELKLQGKQIARSTADQLIFAVGRDLITLKNELAKVAAYAGDSEVVEESDIRAVVTPSTEYKVFDLADNVVEGNAAKAISLMNNLLREGEQRLMLLALLQRQYRQLLFVAILSKNGVQSGTIAQQLAVPPFVVKKMQGMVRRFSSKYLKECYDYCVDTEFLIKSGQLAEEGALEQVVFYLLGGEKKRD